MEEDLWLLCLVGEGTGGENPILLDIYDEDGCLLAEFRYSILVTPYPLASVSKLYGFTFSCIQLLTGTGHKSIP